MRKSRAYIVNLHDYIHVQSTKNPILLQPKKQKKEHNENNMGIKICHRRGTLNKRKKRGKQGVYTHVEVMKL